MEPMRSLPNGIGVRMAQLAAAGMLALALLEVWRRRGIGWAGWTAALGIASASGLNAMAILQVGSLFFSGRPSSPYCRWEGWRWPRRGVPARGERALTSAPPATAASPPPASP